MARLARGSAAINQQSGVSVRMSIANAENMISNAERRGLLVEENPVVPRLSDLVSLAAGTRGKIELALNEEDGQEEKLIQELLGAAVKNVFEGYGDLKQLRPLLEWFEGGKTFLTGDRLPSTAYVQRLGEVPALQKAVARLLERPELCAIAVRAPAALTASVIELLLEGLHSAQRLNKTTKTSESVFRR
jgi:magnesium chelatase subunit I